MNLKHAHTPTTTTHHGRPRQADAHFSGGWLVLVRVAWVLVVMLAVGIFIVSISFKYTDVLYLVPSFIFEFVYLATGVAIFWHRPDDRMALVTSFALVTFGTTFQISSLATGTLPHVVHIMSLWLAFLANTCLGLFFYVFPTGQFVPRWTHWLAVCWIAYWGFNNVFLASFIASPGLNTVMFLGFLASVVPVQVYRYRRVSTLAQRQQTKWVIFGLSVAIVGFLVTITVITRFSHLIVGPLLYLFLLFIPLSLGVAILRSQLWDIDIIINRTLVYSTLTACVIALYVLVVVLLGALFQASGNLLISLLATGLIAVLFQPLRERRLMFGERDTPYRVISHLGQRLEATLAPEAVLPTIVETVAQALKLPYTAIALQQDGAFVITATHGSAKNGLLHLPLNYQSEQIGELILAPRGHGESFTSADRALLDDLTRQAGVAAHAVRLTTDLQHLTAALQQSRTQLVTAREEERRRLRRDLHDGLGPTLGAITLTAGSARYLYTRDAAAADALMDKLERDIAATVAEIRRLVYALRPPVLDEHGLVAAIRECAMNYATVGEEGGTSTSFALSIHAPEHLPSLPAAVEVAAYRIAQEALTNVARHARARTCVVCLSLSDMLQLDITDDGIGLQKGQRLGVGLLSMRERAMELGGTCEVQSLPAGGTRVLARLPWLQERGSPENYERLPNEPVNPA